jgi:hypothetical protein
MPRRVAGQGRAAELGVARQVVGDAHVQVGEVAAAAAGDADLLGELGGVVDDQHAAPALAGFGGAHHAGGAGADHDHVEAGGLVGVVHGGRWAWAERPGG